MKPKIVVFTGAGISAESGIKTFRDSGGLWENYQIEQVATPEGWARNPKLVLDFYNQRRIQANNAEPNKGHLALVTLEEKYDVHIITQNVDNLHERAGSSKITHLHGELTKSRSSLEPSLIYDVRGNFLNMGDLCELGSQLRPHIVWFGEAVPEMSRAIDIMQNVDVFIVIGTSMQVYPAASLMDYVSNNTAIYVIDPDAPRVRTNNIEYITEKASLGVPKMVAQLLKKV